LACAERTTFTEADCLKGREFSIQFIEYAFAIVDAPGLDIRQATRDTGIQGAKFALTVFGQA
jgi:hypothetical protein